MSEAILVALIAGVFGLLAELLRRGTRDKSAHEEMADTLGEIRKDIGGLRAEVRQTNSRVDHLGRRLDDHLDPKGDSHHETS